MSDNTIDFSALHRIFADAANDERSKKEAEEQMNKFLQDQLVRESREKILAYLDEIAALLTPNAVAANSHKEIYNGTIKITAPHLSDITGLIASVPEFYLPVRSVYNGKIPLQFGIASEAYEYKTILEIISKNSGHQLANILNAYDIQGYSVESGSVFVSDGNYHNNDGPPSGEFVLVFFIKTI